MTTSQRISANQAKHTKMQNVWVRKTKHCQYAVILKERYWDFSHRGFSHNHPQLLTWFCVCVLTQNSSLDLPHTKVLYVCVCAQSCLTLCDPMDCSLPGSSVHGILQARILEWDALLSSRKYSQPRDWTWIPCIGWQILYHCTNLRNHTQVQLSLNFFGCLLWKGQGRAIECAGKHSFSHMFLSASPLPISRLSFNRLRSLAHWSLECFRSVTPNVFSSAAVEYLELWWVGVGSYWGPGE